MEKKLTPIIGILSFKAWEDGDNIRLKASCVLKMQGSSEPIDTDKVTVDFALMKNAAEIRFKDRYGRKLAKGFRLNSFELSIDRTKCEALDIQNKLIVNYDGKYMGRFLYSMYDMKKGRNKNSELFIRDGITMYFRQSRFNSLTFTVRETNIYDYPEGQDRIRRARRAALNRKKRRVAAGKAKPDISQEPIFMYEKNCSRYEESASVLYEKLIDEGYDNVFFIVNEDNPAIRDLPDKYRKNLVWKDSDRHLELFFESDRFLSTEATDHALQLRIASKPVLDKQNSRDLRYVFLQHGVMYMVSLNSEQRTGFGESNIGLHRVVVSSEAEAKHFIDLGGMKRKELYVTGLAKFDRSFRNEGADRIVIMPTWRRWETNQARLDFSQTGYFRMMERMLGAVPEELRNKVIILPHPLMKNSFSRAPEIEEHIVIADNYDKVLRDCDLLITDYSSIAYDAFYRGANVVFCWDEKDECMSHYGEGAYLMLNEGNVFGDICMNSEELTAAVNRRYGQPQPAEYKEAYSKLVEFSDGKNTERIIECLRRDHII